MNNFIHFIRKNLFAILVPAIPAVGYSLAQFFYLGEYNYYGIPFSMLSTTFSEALPFIPILMPVYYLLGTIVVGYIWLTMKLAGMGWMKGGKLKICTYYAIRFGFPLVILGIYTHKLLGLESSLQLTILYIVLFYIAGMIESILYKVNINAGTALKNTPRVAHFTIYRLFYYVNTFLLVYSTLGWVIFVSGDRHAARQSSYLTPDNGVSVIVGYKDDCALAVNVEDLGKQSFKLLSRAQYSSCKMIELKDRKPD